MTKAGLVVSAWRLIRPHQWAKNLLVLVPAAFAHQLGRPETLLRVVLAFLAFNFTASLGYVVNDILDRERDRLHKRKKNRPIAGGAISVPVACAIGAVLFLGALALGAFLGVVVLWSLGGYLVLTTLYSKWLKERVLIDVLALASLYTSRIIVGAVAAGVVPSVWLLSLSMFMFFSLALVKRCTELMLVDASEKGSGLHGRDMRGRDYALADADTLRAMGIASSTTAVLVLALYIDTSQAAHQYANPLWLWPTCPILWYWMCRMWIKTTRGQMHDDPIVYSLTDRGSWMSFAALAFCWAAASLGLAPHLG
jgi:4-hydroxybenzoate polyprenyltransferase